MSVTDRVHSLINSKLSCYTECVDQLRFEVCIVDVLGFGF